MLLLLLCDYIHIRSYLYLIFSSYRMFLSILTLKMSITITAEDAFYDKFLISFFFGGGGGGGGGRWTFE